MKQCYRPDFCSNTLASLKPEISKALDSHLYKVWNNDNTKVLHTASGTEIPSTMTPVEWSHVHYANKQADTTMTTTQIQANFWPEKTASSWVVLDSFCDRWKAWVPREGALWLIVNLKSTVFAPSIPPRWRHTTTTMFFIWLLVELESA